MIVLDTNVLSELMSPTPSAPVQAWFLARPDEDLRVTAITIAEIRYGIARLPAGRRRRVLAAAAEEVLGRFGSEVLPFDAPAAARFALVVTDRDRGGRQISGFDAQIAAICVVHGASLATRNVTDFSGIQGLVVTDPFDDAGG